MGVRAAPTMTTSDMRWSSSIVGRRGCCGRRARRLGELDREAQLRNAALDWMLDVLQGAAFAQLGMG